MLTVNLRIVSLRLKALAEPKQSRSRQQLRHFPEHLPSMNLNAHVWALAEIWFEMSLEICKRPDSWNVWGGVPGQSGGKGVIPLKRGNKEGNKMYGINTW